MGAANPVGAGEARELPRIAPQLTMDLAEVRNGKLRVDVALRMQARVQRRVIEYLRFAVRQPGDRGGGQIVRDRALGDAQRGGDLGVGQRAFVLEFPGIVTANPTNLTAVSDMPQSGHHPSDSPVNIVGFASFGTPLF